MYTPQRRLKIVHLTSVHKPFDNRIFKQCRTLSAAGFDVALIVPAERDIYAQGVHIRAVPHPANRRARMLRTCMQIYRTAVAERGDIYQIHDPELLPVGLTLRWRGNRVIFDVHEDVPKQLSYKAWIPPALRRVIAASYDVFERAAARRLSAIVTANEDIDYRFVDVNANVVPIHNYAELSEFPVAPRLEAERYASGVVLHCGGLTERTAVVPVIKAFGLLPSESNAKLVITGHSDSPALARELGTMPGWQRAEWHGMLLREEMVQLLGTAAVGLVLYDGIENHASIRSNRLFESMAAGLAVIVPDFPEWKRTVENVGCGIAVNPNSPFEISNGLRRLLENPGECAAMAARGRVAVLARYNWNSELPKLISLYQRIAPQTAAEMPVRIAASALDDSQSA